MGGDGWISGQKTKHDLTTAENAFLHCGNFSCVFLLLPVRSVTLYSLYFHVKAYYTLTPLWPALILTQTFFAGCQ